MRRLCRRYLKSSTTREIFTRVNMKAGIALLVSLSGRRHSWLTENVRLRKGSGTYKRGELFLQAFQISGPADKTYRGESGFYTACFQTERDAEQFLKAGLEDLCVSRTTFDWEYRCPLMTSTWYMFGLTPFPTILPPLTTCPRTIRITASTGLRMFILWKGNSAFPHHHMACNAHGFG